MKSIEQNLAEIKKRVKHAASQCDRDHKRIDIVAVSKSQPIKRIKQAYDAGLRKFGESYLQEALPKMQALDDLDIEWHFIGPVQSNKTRSIAEHFQWVHSVDRYKIAQRLNEQRPDDLPQLNICIQLNISDEQSKSGLLKDAVLEFAGQLSTLSRLKLRGLMAIPEKTDQHHKQRESFAMVRHLFDDLNQHGIRLDTLSMGMSEDLESAINEGATVLRIGTALFGTRSAA